jgi:hypothetical protein
MMFRARGPLGVDILKSTTASLTAGRHTWLQEIVVIMEALPPIDRMPREPWLSRWLC